MEDKETQKSNLNRKQMHMRK